MEIFLPLVAYDISEYKLYKGIIENNAWLKYKSRSLSDERRAHIFKNQEKG